MTKWLLLKTRHKRFFFLMCIKIYWSWLYDTILLFFPGIDDSSLKFVSWLTLVTGKNVEWDGNLSIKTVDWMHTVLRSTWEYFNYTETPLLSAKGCSPLARSTFVPSPLGNFADVTDLKVHFLRKILSFVCILSVGAFSRNEDLQ
jgi:hypothetical protein